MTNNTNNLTNIINELKNTIPNVSEKELLDILQNILQEYKDKSISKEEITEIVLDSYYQTFGISKKTRILIDTYINNNQLLRGKQNSINYLLKLIVFLTKNNIDILYTYEYLINNNIIKTCIENIFTKDSITRESFDKLTYENNLLQFLELYCINNNIEIIESLSLENDSLFTDESTSDYIKKIKKNSILTREEEYNLIKLYKNLNDQNAFNELVTHNLRLVYSIALKFIKGPVELSDLIQDGTEGLIIAIQKFDYKKNVRLSTYATFWIKHKILLSIAKTGRGLHVPYNLIEEVTAYEKSRASFIEEYQKYPTYEELSNYSNIPLDKLFELDRISNLEMKSLNKTVGDDETNFEEIIEVENKYTSPEESVFASDLLNMIIDFLNDTTTDVRDQNKLTKREAEIIKARHPIFNQAKVSCKSLTERFNVSRETVRKNYKRACKKMQRKMISLGYRGNI